VVFAAVRFPAIPGLILGCLAGALVAMGFQGVSVTDLLGVAQNGFESKRGWRWWTTCSPGEDCST
jgi:NhaC family Na+:H+ antiporter